MTDLTDCPNNEEERHDDPDLEVRVPPKFAADIDAKLGPGRGAGRRVMPSTGPWQ
jgi:hypothetical protein